MYVNDSSTPFNSLLFIFLLSYANTFFLPAKQHDLKTNATDTNTRRMNAHSRRFKKTDLLKLQSPMLQLFLPLQGLKNQDKPHFYKRYIKKKA